MSSSLFVSCASYFLGRSLGLEGGLQRLHEQLASPSRDTLPCTRTIARLKPFDPLCYFDTGATVIAKSRSRAFHAARESGRELWISVDDDVEATSSTLAWLVEAARAPGPRCVLVPMRLRGRESEEVDRISIEFPLVKTRRKLLGDLGRIDGESPEVVACVRGGLGLFAVNRAGIEALFEAYRSTMWYRDDDGVERVAVFRDELADGRWSGEDLAFCDRARAAGLELEALVTGLTSHAGAFLDLVELR